MGRTVSTFRELIEQELQNWERVFGRALRKEEREHLELMFNRVRLYIQACTYQFPAHAMDGINVAVGLDHEIRLRKIEERLGIRLDAQWDHQRMATRPLPFTPGDDAVADRTEPETPSTD